MRRTGELHPQTSHDPIHIVSQIPNRHELKAGEFMMHALFVF